VTSEADVTAFVATITSDGKTMDPTIELMSLEIRKELDRIPEAQLVVLDGDPAARKFPVSDGGFFNPGKKIVIKLRYEGEADVQVFAGLVVRQVVQVGDDGTELHVELKDAAIAMTRQRRGLVMFKSTDVDIYRKLIGRNKVKVGKLPPAGAKHEQLVQYNATDWDFLLSRADVNGEVVLVDDGEVSVLAMSAARTKTVALVGGIQYNHDPELAPHASGQYEDVAGHAWDPAQAAAATATGKRLDTTAGDSIPATLAEKMGDPLYNLYSPGAATEAELKSWAGARMARSRLAMVRGHVVVPGKADLKPFFGLKLAGVGKRYNGTLLISAVTHKLDHEGWKTELQLGLSPDWFARKPDIADVPAGGLLPPATTLHVGVVDALAGDEGKLFRVRVKLPGLGTNFNAVWARLARPDAGDKRGFNFWPEVGDEVVVGFFAGDPRQAVVLGSLYGAKAEPPNPPDDKNELRAIVSREGNKIELDDKKKALTITTPGGRQIVISDDAKSITLTDPDGGSITLGDQGIELKTSKDVKIDAGGKVVIKGSAVDVQ
jgi:Rhs element Vgr protein